MLPSDLATEPPAVQMDPAAIDPLLAGLPLIASLSDSEKRLVSACFESVAFEYGETVVAEGEPATAYFVISSGRARVLTVGPDGREVPLKHAHAG